MFPDETFEVEGVSVPSGVSDQPKSSAETITGARNRVNNAFLAVANADFWVGIEGGIEEHSKEIGAYAWVMIKSEDNRFGKGSTGIFFLPSKVAELIRQGKELGEASDIVFGRKNSKQENGTIGILTNNIMDRTAYYRDAVVLALVPFKNPNLYSA